MIMSNLNEKALRLKDPDLCIQVPPIIKNKKVSKKPDNHLWANWPHGFRYNHNELMANWPNIVLDNS